MTLLTAARFITTVNKFRGTVIKPNRLTNTKSEFATIIKGNFAGVFTINYETISEPVVNLKVEKIILKLTLIRHGRNY